MKIMRDDDDASDDNNESDLNKLNEIAPYIGLSGTFRRELSNVPCSRSYFNIGGFRACFNIGNGSLLGASSCC